MPIEQAAAPEWSVRILRLLHELKITQAALAERLGVSPATVSRWIQGKHEPTAEGYVLLGNLALGKECAYFWERAGVEIGKLAEGGQLGLTTAPRAIPEVRILSARRPPRTGEETAQAVAIPLLALTVYGDTIPPDSPERFADARVEEMLLAPPDWCPHPEQMVAMHLAGESMLPVIGPGSILFVDRSQTDRDALNHKLVVVSHRDLGLKMARFERIGGADLLLSANHRYPPVDVTNAAKWRIFGEVLWWITRVQSHAA